LQVQVASQVPGGVALVADLGPGCGSPSPLLATNGLPTIPSPNFAVTITSTPSAGLMLFAALQTDHASLGNGCTRYLETSTLATYGFLMTDGSGAASAPLPLPAVLAYDGIQLYWEAAQLVPGGPLLATATLSNGLLVRLGVR
jgi:hypothetical protein